MKVLGVLHTSLTVADLDRSVAFYRDNLGLGLERINTVEGEALSKTVGYKGARVRVAMLRKGTHRVELIQYLHPSGERRARPRKHTGSAHIAFDVADIDAAYRELRGHGVVFTAEPQDFGPVRACYFVDPDGITLELIKRKERLPRRSPALSTATRTS